VDIATVVTSPRLLLLLLLAVIIVLAALVDWATGAATSVVRSATTLL